MEVQQGREGMGPVERQRRREELWQEMSVETHS